MQRIPPSIRDPKSYARRETKAFLSQILPERELQRIYSLLSRRFGLKYEFSAVESEDLSEGSVRYRTPWVRSRVFNPDSPGVGGYEASWQLFWRSCDRFLAFNPRSDIELLREFSGYFQEVYPDPEAGKTYYLVLRPEDPFFPILQKTIERRYISLGGNMTSALQRLMEASQNCLLKHRNSPEYAPYLLHLLIWLNFLFYLPKVSRMKKVLLDEEKSESTWLYSEWLYSSLVSSILIFASALERAAAEEVPPDVLRNALFPQSILLLDVPLVVSTYVFSEDEIDPEYRPYAIRLSNGTYLSKQSDSLCFWIPRLQIDISRVR